MSPRVRATTRAVHSLGCRSMREIAPTERALPEFAIRQSRRARRLTLRVYPGGRVEVTVPVGVTPSEVERFVQAQKHLYAYMEANTELFDRYRELAEEYNSALEASGTQLKVLCDTQLAGVSCGPFEFKHFATKYDGDALLYELGGNDEEFKKLGGLVETVRVNKVDTKMMESLITRGAVPEVLQRKFVKRIANYDKPKPLGLP